MLAKSFGCKQKKMSVVPWIFSRLNLKRLAYCSQFGLQLLTALSLYFDSVYLQSAVIHQ
jgi:hypothetical protein